MINVLIQNDTKNGAPGDFSLLAPINDLCFNINLFYARAQKSLSSVIALVTESSQTKITEGCFHSRPLKNNANKIPPSSFHRNFAKISDGKVKVNWLFFLSVDFQGWCLIRRLENLWELLWKVRSKNSFQRMNSLLCLQHSRLFTNDNKRAKKLNFLLSNMFVSRKISIVFFKPSGSMLL